MTEESDDFNIEEEINELPGYIKSIINDCDTFDKKESSNKINENDNNLNDCLNKSTEKNEKSENSSNINANIAKDEENDIDNNNKDIDEDIFFSEDKENDYNIENIFNSKSDFFNQQNNDKIINVNINTDKNINENLSIESKENINNNIQLNNNKENISNNANIKLYYIQENNLLNIKRSFRLQSILQNNLAGYKSNTYECSICFRRIQNYGLLSNCDDVFCYDCIKQWRTEAISKNKREMFRRCPICNCESPILIKSKNYVQGEEKRKKFYELKQEKKISAVSQ